MHPGEQSFPVWSAFGVLEDCAVALSTSNRWAPVRPERSRIDLQTSVSKLQVGEIRRGFACPICLTGIVEPGDAICKMCAAEEEDELPW